MTYQMKNLNRCSRLRGNRSVNLKVNSNGRGLERYRRFDAETKMKILEDLMIESENYNARI
jgi:hypothetical protein